MNLLCFISKLVYWYNFLAAYFAYYSSFPYITPLLSTLDFTASLFFWQVVNLIPFNPIGTLSQFGTSSEQRVTRFQKILRSTYDIRTTVRKQMGQDISGACGQLVVNLPNKKSTDNAAPLTDIEDLHL